MMKRLIAGLALASVGAAQAASALSEGFDNVGALAGAGWSFTNNSTPPLGLGWFQGNTGIFDAAAGAASSYAAANFASTGAGNGAVSDWIVTPALLLDGNSTVSFAVRVAGEGFLDKLEVRMSTTGADVGTTPTSVGDFTTLLGSFSSSSAGGWIGFSYATFGLTSATTARIAFRYVVDDVSSAGNYLGIDNVNVVAAVPEPASYLMLGVGLAAVMLRRRCAA